MVYSFTEGNINFLLGKYTDSFVEISNSFLRNIHFHFGKLGNMKFFLLNLRKYKFPDSPR